MTQKFELIDAFSQRPTLQDVAVKQLSRALIQAFPGAGIDPEMSVITRNGSGAEQKSETLIKNLKKLLLTGKTPRWQSGANTVVINPEASAPVAAAVDFERFNTVVDTVALELIGQFQAAVADFWNRPSSCGQSLWGQVSDALKQNFLTALDDAHGLSDDQSRFLHAIAAFAEKPKRDFMLQATPGAAGDAIRVCIPYRVSGDQTEEVPVPVLVAVGQWRGAEMFMTWQSPGITVVHSSRSALESSLSADHAGGMGSESTGWRLHEPEDDIFDVLTQVVLESQLRDVGAIDPTTMQSFDDIERCLAGITDISPVLVVPVLDITDPQPLPEWLQTASAADRLDYSRRMTALASVQARCNGHSFTDGLPPMLEYANQVLQQKIEADHPQAVELSVADLDVLINKVVAAAVPAGGQIAAVGSVEPVRMSVAEFALENLASVPNGTIAVVHRKGGTVPGWFSADYLKLLVCHVDIGRSYPALVQRYLITDEAEATRRQTLFADQLRVQLPLKALEQKIRGEGGFFNEGYRRVVAIMQPPDQRDQTTRNTIVCPLAFVSAPGARADGVSNMFVIADRNRAIGPVVLYRPLSSQPLMAFVSWSALRAAIVQSGDLQDEVLAWMSEHARQIYANGGFNQPHVVRFGQGSEFAPLETPPPAEFASDEISGDLLQALFNANANALVQLADRYSVSNSESRWALIKRGGWLALGAVMPFISGPAGAALWLMQLMSNVQGVLATGHNASASERATAMGDLLLTLAMILLQRAMAAGSASVPRRRPVAQGPAAASTDGQASPAVLAPTSSRTVLDFSWSSRSQTLTPSQSIALEHLRIAPTPAALAPSQEPGFQGLCPSGGHWYAQVGEALFRVRVTDDGVFVIDPQHADRSGPRLLFEDHAWRLDLGLRLRGGGPKRNARQMAQENAATLKRVVEQKRALLDRQSAQYLKIVECDTLLVDLPIEQHGQVIPVLEAALQDIIEVIEQKQVLDTELRPADRMGDKAYGKDLKGVSRRICFLEGLLLNDMLKLAREDLSRMQAVAGDAVNGDNVDIYLTLFEKVLVLQEAGVRWSTIREGLWQRLRAVPKVGEEYWRAEVLELHASNLFTGMEWRISRMWSLLELCFSADLILKGGGAIALKALRVDVPLHAALTSHAELGMPNDYSLAEQISVLESSLREYDRASMIALSTFESEPEAVVKVNFLRFLEDLSAISDSAEHRLSDLIRESEEPPAKPSEYAPRVKRPRMRVFKTRGQRTLIGRLRDDEEPLHGEVVEVKSTVGDSVVGSYHQHAAGDWVELEVQRPKPANRESIVALPELTRRGHAMLERVEPDIASAQRQARRANEPEDMEDILMQKADKVRDLVNKLEIHSADPDLAQAARVSLDSLIADLRAGEVRLREQGRSLRIAMIKAQPPTAARVSYLDRQHEVNIASFDGRKNMSGARRNDFLQEYVIRDKENRVLWWAHFHYATEDASPDAFTAAHLKLPDQRFLGYKALVKAAKDNKEVVSIYRSAIGKELAQRLFLNLTSDA